MSGLVDRLAVAMAISLGLICVAPVSARAQSVIDGRYHSYPQYEQVAPDDDDEAFLSGRPTIAPRPPMIVPDRPMIVPDHRIAPDPRMVVPGNRAVVPQPDTPADTAEVPVRFRRQVVAYPSREPSGTIVIDTPNTYLYYVLGQGRAIRYGIGVGREGFTWSGVRTIGRKVEWPDWTPPAEMLARQPYLPRFMAGGPGNPLGARAMYLQGTLYRIHGTSEPNSIGKHVSSGCIRMLNEDAIDLYNRTPIGAKVVVLPDHRRARRDEADMVQPQRQSVLPAPESESTLEAEIDPYRPVPNRPFFAPPVPPAPVGPPGSQIY